MLDSLFVSLYQDDILDEILDKIRASDFYLAQMGEELKNLRSKLEESFAISCSVKIRFSQ